MECAIVYQVLCDFTMVHWFTARAPMKLPEVCYYAAERSTRKGKDSLGLNSEFGAILFKIDVSNAYVILEVGF